MRKCETFGMRILLILAMVAPTVAMARKHKAAPTDARVVAVDDAPNSKRALEQTHAPPEVGSRRDITLQAAAPEVKVAKASPAPAEHVQTSEDPAAGRAEQIQSLSGASDELAWRKANRKKH